MSNLEKNPFNESSYFYNRYMEYIKISPQKNIQLRESPAKFPESLSYNFVDYLPQTMKADDSIPFSESVELDMSRDINTESIPNIPNNPYVPIEYTGTETSADDPEYLQISSFEPITEPSFRSTSRYIFREISKPDYKPIPQITQLSKPMKLMKYKRPSGRRPNMPLYDDAYHINRRTNTVYKKQLMYKTMDFSKFLTTFGDLSITKFYSKFEIWLDSNNINDLEIIKTYEHQYKLYRNVTYENV